MHILNEHKLKYLNRRVTEIQELYDSLKKGEFESIASIGHRLKGNGETFGFPQISTIGIELEKAAHAKDSATLRQSIDQLKVFVDENLLNFN